MLNLTDKRDLRLGNKCIALLDLITETMNSKYQE